LPLTEIWHHHAHASALAWEFPDVDEWIVFAWDGVGLGEDHTLWGGEAFTGAPARWRHAASFRPFRLPGGDKAGREPWRAAAALLWETGQPAPFAPEPLHQAWTARLNSPASSSVGRLFDAAAALCGVCTHASFEGEGPMRLEALLAVRPELSRREPVIARRAATRQSRMPTESTDSGSPRPCGPRDDGIHGETAGGETVELPLQRDATGIWRSDWAPLLPMLADTTLPVAERAASFHLSLAHALVEQAKQLREQTGIHTIGLTGGVFQNRVLAEAAIGLIEAAGFIVHLPQRLPVNDAGLSFGQVIEFLHQ
jgi:hydrogenase maturation protein HypF